MSRQTYDALDQALREHVADISDGAMLTDWIVTTASVGGFEGTGYSHMFSEVTSAHARMGLTLAAYLDCKTDWTTAAEGDDDDE